jgi:cob(I)alamin adenosyltransferase
MKIYTGSGDRGQTSLFSGERVGKDQKRIEAYGDLDELNAVLGALSASLPQEASESREEIHAIQCDLFQAGAWLATTPDSPSLEALEAFDSGRVEVLERSIDRMEQGLPVLKGFILPGGHVAASWAHIARTVCRRVERRVVALSHDPAEYESPLGVVGIIAFLNRLSDYLFVLARHCNRVTDVPEIEWKK